MLRTYSDQKKRKFTAEESRTITTEYNLLRTDLANLRRKLKTIPENEPDKLAICKDAIRKTEQKAGEKFELYSQIPDKITDKIEKTAKGQLPLTQFFKRQGDENGQPNLPFAPANVSGNQL